jgi:hypothetical protein
VGIIYVLSARVCVDGGGFVVCVYEGVNCSFLQSKSEAFKLLCTSTSHSRHQLWPKNKQPQIGEMNILMDSNT